MERGRYEKLSHCKVRSARTREGEHLIGTGIIAGLQWQLNVSANKTWGQQTAILPCSTLNLFSLEIIHTAFKAFKIHETIQNWHQISWVFCKLATAGQESAITLH